MPIKNKMLHIILSYNNNILKAVERIPAKKQRHTRHRIFHRRRPHHISQHNTNTKRHALENICKWAFDIAFSFPGKMSSAHNCWCDGYSCSNSNRRNRPDWLGHMKTTKSECDLQANQNDIQKRIQESWMQSSIIITVFQFDHFPSSLFFFIYF